MILRHGGVVPTRFSRASVTTLLGIYSLTLMAVMGVSSLGPALPGMRVALGLSADQVASVVSVFTIPSVVLGLFIGALSDRIGRKRVLVPSLLLFGGASVGCAFVPSFGWLLALRFLQGVGVSALAILNLTLIGDLFVGDLRARALGFNSTVLGVGMGLFPMLGGLLAAHTWYAPFWLGLLALPVAAWVGLFLRLPAEPPAIALVDYLVGALRQLADLRVCLLMVMGALTFVMHYGAYVTYLPLYLDARLGLGPARIGLVMGVSALGSALASACVGAIGERVHERHWLWLACVLYAISLWLVPATFDMAAACAVSGAFGVAHGLCVPSQHRVWAQLAPQQHRGAFMSLKGTSFRLGQTLGPFWVGSWAHAAGFQAAFQRAALVSLGLFVCSVLLFRRIVR